jgi:hypothetical protein
MHVISKNKLETQNHISKHSYQDVTNHCQTKIIQSI